MTDGFVKRMPDREYTHGQVFPHPLEDYKPYVTNPLKDLKEAGGIKHDQDKPMMDLLDSGFLEDMASVLTFGAKKYAKHNWRKGISVSRSIAAIYRHLGALNRGEDLDPESGCHHEACIAINSQFINWMLKNRPDLDDRFKGNTDE